MTKTRHVHWPVYSPTLLCNPCKHVICHTKVRGHIRAGRGSWKGQVRNSCTSRPAQPPLLARWLALAVMDDISPEVAAAAAVEALWDAVVELHAAVVVAKARGERAHVAWLVRNGPPGIEDLHALAEARLLAQNTTPAAPDWPLEEVLYDLLFEDLDTAVYEAIADEDDALAGRLLDNYTADRRGEFLAAMLLRWASEHGSVPILQRALTLFAAAPLGERAQALEGGMVAACVRGNVPVVTALLAAGADANSVIEESHGTDALPWFILGLSCRSGHLELVELLLAAGANVHANRTEALDVACQAGHAHIVDRLLAAGANRADDSDVLWTAAVHGHAAVVKRLLDPAASPPVRVEEIKRAIEKVCSIGTVDVLGLLLRSLSHGEAVVDHQLVEVAFGGTLHSRILPLRAFVHGRNDIVEALLRFGANPQDLPWNAMPWPEIGGRYLMAVQPANFHLLDRKRRVLWVRVVLLPRLRLRRALRRARVSLDRPPSGAPLGTDTPTRDALIAHLQTAGRRFAREYWLEGIPVFFPKLVAALGPLPECFRERV